MKNYLENIDKVLENLGADKEKGFNDDQVIESEVFMVKILFPRKKKKACLKEF